MLCKQFRHFYLERCILKFIYKWVLKECFCGLRLEKLKFVKLIHLFINGFVWHERKFCRFQILFEHFELEHVYDGYDGFVLPKFVKFMAILIPLFLVSYLKVLSFPLIYAGGSGVIFVIDISVALGSSKTFRHFSFFRLNVIKKNNKTEQKFF